MQRNVDWKLIKTSVGPTLRELLIRCHIGFEFIRQDLHHNETGKGIPGTYDGWTTIVTRPNHRTMQRMLNAHKLCRLPHNRVANWMAVKGPTFQKHGLFEVFKRSKPRPSKVFVQIIFHPASRQSRIGSFSKFDMCRDVLKAKSLTSSFYLDLFVTKYS